MQPRAQKQKRGCSWTMDLPLTWTHRTILWKGQWLTWKKQEIVLRLLLDIRTPSSGSFFSYGLFRREDWAPWVCGTEFGSHWRCSLPLRLEDITRHSRTIRHVIWFYPESNSLPIMYHLYTSPHPWKTRSLQSNHRANSEMAHRDIHGLRFPISTAHLSAVHGRPFWW